MALPWYVSAKPQGTDTDTDDLVTKTLYYENTNGDRTYIFRQLQMESDGNGGLQEYARVEYQRYGYLTQFNEQSDGPSELTGLVWKQIDARNKTTTFTYSTDNQMVTRVDLPDTSYTTTSYLQIDSKDSVYVDTVVDTRGIYTKYTRDNTNHNLVTDIGVSDDQGQTYATTKHMTYSSQSEVEGLLESETVDDIEDGTGDMTTTYGYEDPEVSGKYRTSPTSTSYDYYNGTTYATKYNVTSYDDNGLTTWTRTGCSASDGTGGIQTDNKYDEHNRLIETDAPADSNDGGTITGHPSSTSITISGKNWVTNQFEGMQLVIGSSTYPIESNTTDTITVSSGNLDSESGTADIRPYTTSEYKPCCDLVTTSRDSRGYYTHYSYDSANRLEKTWTDISGQSSTYPLVTYAYDGLNRKTSVTTYSDSSTGRVTNYTYDQLGRLIQLTYPYDTNPGDILLNEYYQYDKAGLMVAKLVGTVTSGAPDTGYKLTTYAYDELGRLTDVKYGCSTSAWPITSGVDSYGDISVSNPSVAYSYYNGSNLREDVTRVEGANTYVDHYVYDAFGRLTVYAPALPLDYTVEYTYNNANQKTQVLVKYDGDPQYKTDYAYFKNGWLKEAMGYERYNGDWYVDTWSDFDYDSTGRRTNRCNSTSVEGDEGQSAYTYNVRGEVKQIQHLDPSDNEEYGMTYTRDGAGNPLAVGFSSGWYCPTAYSGKTVSYAYDEMNRLISEQVGTNTAKTWSYDWVGNRSQSFTATYNQVDQLTNNNSGYVYDGLGNLTHVPSASATTRTDYSYNDANLLCQVTDVVSGTGTSTTMHWDADNNRIKIERGDRTWQFLYDPTASVPSVLLYLDSNNAGPQHCIREPGGELLADDGSEGPRNYYYDALGNAVYVSSWGGPYNGVAYGAWGDVVESLNTPDTPDQFVGQLGYYTHNSSAQGSALGSLMQLGVRFYDAGTGRFTQRDPLDGLNRYSYADDSPLTYVDPLGLSKESEDWVKKNVADLIKKIAALDTKIKNDALTTGKNPDPADTLMVVNAVESLIKILRSREEGRKILQSCEPFFRDAQSLARSGHVPDGMDGTCITCFGAFSQAAGNLISHALVMKTCTRLTPGNGEPCR